MQNVAPPSWRQKQAPVILGGYVAGKMPALPPGIFLQEAQEKETRILRIIRIRKTPGFILEILDIIVSYLRVGDNGAGDETSCSAAGPAASWY
ncbi:MAG TPA: hypothetical protein VM658_11355 [bacterium]|nr:hypothetical protein [bacterium]